MQVCSLSLVDFRSYALVEVGFAGGLTAIVGPNGEGKTNLLEAIGFAAGLGSLRGAPEAALIRDGAEAAVVRCLARTAEDREVLVEAELARSRPNRIRVNHQPVARRRDLVGVLAATVFSPTDLDLVKGEPARRRRWIDDAVTAVRPSLGALRSEVDRILRQRNTLLRQAGGRATDDVTITLDVWDAKLATAGNELRAHRLELLQALRPRIRSYYGQIARARGDAGANYVSCWDASLAQALAAARPDDLRRATSTVGPHRDDILMRIRGLPAPEPCFAGRAAVPGLGRPAGSGRRGARAPGCAAGSCSSMTSSLNWTVIERPRCWMRCRRASESSPPRWGCPPESVPTS